ncbi:DUF6355 family natural product biosynthesis protein [Fodinicola feengrottensis]|uniref:Secreted protein n=1 Tax=Fodinicola feengrottensis TaxID=435914 RepID=A0ABN2FTM9_9ACTN|nr:DUF6355 family natural product biosynthesis protein [Fodinicola feengrottensis]
MKKFAIALATAALGGGLLAGVAAQPAAAAVHLDGPPATCGFWADSSGPWHAHYGHCAPDGRNVVVVVHTWFGDNWTFCALANTTTDLGLEFNIRTADFEGGFC